MELEGHYKPRLMKAGLYDRQLFNETMESRGLEYVARIFTE
jgi:hypothetical protein